MRETARAQKLETVGQALRKYEGELACTLRLTECLDSGEVVEDAEISKELKISAIDVWRHQCDAFDGVMRMI